jgi:hypothetical protein
MLEGQDDAAPAGRGGAFGLTAGDIRDAAGALEPGMSAGFIVFEHVGARALPAAIAETEGVPFAQGFLTPDAVAAIQA